MLLALCGIALLFQPQVTGSWTDEGAQMHVLNQVLGAALLGFAAANWIARRSMLGGIYGRAIVAGNQVFALVGALVLLGSTPAQPNPGYWLLFALLAAGAALFSWLLIRGPRVEPRAR